MYGVIYKVTNKINGKIYIGRTKNFKRRKKEYMIKKITKRSQNYLIMQEIVKYGRETLSLLY